MKRIAIVALIVAGFAATNTHAAFTPLYEYDANDVPFGPVLFWNDTVSIAANARNWDMPPAAATNLPASNPLLGRAVNFDGTQAPFGGSGFAITGAFGDSDFTNGTGGRNASFEVWFKPDALTEGVLLESGGANTGFALWMQSDGTLAFNTTGGGSTHVTTAITPSLTDFTQVLGVIDEPNNLTRLYVNGVQVASTPGTRDWTTAVNPAGLAMSTSTVAPSGSSTESFVGEIAIVRVFNEPLPDFVVQAIYVATIPEPGSLALLGLGGLLITRRH